MQNMQSQVQEWKATGRTHVPQTSWKFFWLCY